MTKKIKVLLVDPMETPKIQEIDPSYEKIQQLIGASTLQEVYPWTDPVALICDDCGKLNGSLPNRILYDGKGMPYDIIMGRFLVAGVSPDEFVNLSDLLICKYSSRFYFPDFADFINTMNQASSQDFEDFYGI